MSDRTLPIILGLGVVGLLGLDAAYIGALQTPVAAQTCGVSIGIASYSTSVQVGARGTVAFTLDGPTAITKVQVLLDGQVSGEVTGAELRDMAALRFSVPRTPKVYNLTMTTVDAKGCSTSTGAPRPLTVVGTLPEPPTLVCPTSSRIATLVPIPTMGLWSPQVSGGVAPVTLTCAPVSGALLPVGTTNVSCNATDAAGRTAACVFPATVVVVTPSATPLTLTCPAGISVVAPGQPQFSVPQPSGGVSPYLTFCDHQPTEAFPLGLTTVECRAADFNGTQGACTFPVTITAAQ